MAFSRATKSRIAGGSQVKSNPQDYLKTASGYQLLPATLTQVQQAADRGDPRRLVEIVCDLRARDPHLAGVEQTRRAAVAGKPWELRPTKRRGIDTPAAIVDQCKDMLAQLRGWPDLIGDCQDAVLQPLAAFEKTWEISESQAWPVACDWVHPELFTWNTTYTNVSGLDLGELRLMTQDEPSYGVRLTADKWIIHQLKTRTDWPWRLGHGRPVAWMECFKSFSYQQWCIWLEICAMPLRYASVPESMSAGERADVEAALEVLGSDGFAVWSDQANVTFEASGNNAGDQAYQRMAAACNDEISKCILGHTGSADTTPGRMGGEGLAGEIRQDLVEADARAIEATINRDLLEPFVRLNYGPDVPVPGLHLQVDALVSRKERMDLANRAWAMGWPVDMVATASACEVPLTCDPSRMAPPAGPQGMAQTIAGVNAPQPVGGQ